MVVGALFVTFIPEFLRNFGDFHQILFGLLLVGIIIGLPGGIVDAILRLRRQRRATPVAVHEKR